ncbi:hypothetical protein F5X99DRAFT_426357 [Biscogniauxia marginata]|nr:hypothetical protein F5X99DRAFT_426357 [Biscogniauxia marginata]
MPAKKNNKAQANGTEDGNAITLTPGDIKLLNAIFANATSKPDVNWEACASDLGMKNAKVAKDRFNQVIKKHNWFKSTVTDGVEEGVSTPKAPKAPMASASTATVVTRAAHKRNREASVGDLNNSVKKPKHDATKASVSAEADDKEGLNVADKGTDSENADAKDESEAEKEDAQAEKKDTDMDA